MKLRGSKFFAVWSMFVDHEFKQCFVTNTIEGANIIEIASRGGVIRAGRSERSEFLILGAASVAIFSYWAQRACITFSSSGRSERSEFFAGRSERSSLKIHQSLVVS